MAALLRCFIGSILFASSPGTRVLMVALNLYGSSIFALSRTGQCVDERLLPDPPLMILGDFLLCADKIPPLLLVGNPIVPGGVEIPVFAADPGTIPHVLLPGPHAGHVPAGNLCLPAEQVEGPGESAADGSSILQRAVCGAGLIGYRAGVLIIADIIDRCRPLGRTVPAQTLLPVLKSPPTRLRRSRPGIVFRCGTLLKCKQLLGSADCRITYVVH